MAISAAIFDMDGTLLDSMHVWINIASRYLKTKNITITPKIEKELGGLMLKDIANYFINNFYYQQHIEYQYFMHIGLSKIYY